MDFRGNMTEVSSCVVFIAGFAQMDVEKARLMAGLRK